VTPWHRTGASWRRKCAHFPWSPCSTAQRGAPRQDGERGVEQQMFARGMSMTRVHRFDVTFVAECAVYSARVAVLHPSRWRGLAWRPAGQQVCGTGGACCCSPASISPAPVSAPSSSHVRSPVQMPPAHLFLLLCLPCHAFAHYRPVSSACHRYNSVESGGAEPAQVAYSS
jgi:hypothetical protein